MGGSSPQTVDASRYITPPRSTSGDLNQWASLMGGTQDMQNQLLKETASVVPTMQVADVAGMQDMAQKEAAINAGASQANEKQFNPGAAALRQELPTSLAADLSGMPSQDLSNWWTKMGLSDTVATGTNTGSGFGRSALVDSTRQNYIQERQKEEALASNYLNANQAPVAGLDPGMLASLKATTKNQNDQNIQNYEAGNLQAAGADIAGMNSEIQGLMGATTQANQFDASNYQQYQQAMLNAASNNASAANTASASKSSGNTSMAVGGAAAAATVAAALIAL